MSSRCHQHGAGMWRLRVSCRGASSVNLHGGGSSGTARHQRMERISSSGTRTLSQARSAVNAGVPRDPATVPAPPYSLADSVRRSARKASTSPPLPPPYFRASACDSATAASRGSRAPGNPGTGRPVFRPPLAAMPVWRPAVPRKAPFRRGARNPRCSWVRASPTGSASRRARAARTDAGPDSGGQRARRSCQVIPPWPR